VIWEKCFGACQKNTLCWSTAREIEECELVNRTLYHEKCLGVCKCIFMLFIFLVTEPAGSTNFILILVSYNKTN